jgi:hypothetical protein
MTATNGYDKTVIDPLWMGKRGIGVWEDGWAEAIVSLCRVGDFANSPNPLIAILLNPTFGVKPRDRGFELA